MGIINMMIALLLLAMVQATTVVVRRTVYTHFKFGAPVKVSPYGQIPKVTQYGKTITSTTAHWLLSKRRTLKFPWYKPPAPGTIVLTKEYLTGDFTKNRLAVRCTRTYTNLLGQHKTTYITYELGGSLCYLGGQYWNQGADYTLGW